MPEPTNQLTLTDAVIRTATLPAGKAQHYLHDDKLPGLALRMGATGGRTWVYLFTKPGVRGTQRKTLGASPKYKGSAQDRHHRSRRGLRGRGSERRHARGEAATGSREAAHHAEHPHC
jgi:hypothetical protein